MPGFVRVAYRHGWEVEIVGSTGVVAAKTLVTRDEALAYAESLEPEWIEVGDIVGLGTPAQQRSWTTLQRQKGGSYAPRLLGWQAGRRHLEPSEPTNCLSREWTRERQECPHNGLENRGGARCNEARQGVATQMSQHRLSQYP